MTPEQYIEINGVKVEEFYWNRKLIVYVNDLRIDKTYDEVVKELKARPK